MNYFWNPRFLTWLWIIKNNTYRKNVVGFTCPDYQVLLEYKHGYRKNLGCQQAEYILELNTVVKKCIYQSIVNLSQSFDKRKYTD